MRKLFKSQRKIIIIDFIILLFCIVGIYNVTQKSDLPFIVDSQNSDLLITTIENHQSQFKKGDKLISIDNIKLESREEIEMYLDGRNTGELIKVVVSRDDQLVSETVELRSFYSIPYLVIASLVGILFFIVAIIVVIKCNKENLGMAFHWAFVFTGIIILMTWGNYSDLPFKLGTVTRVGFHFGYLLAPVYFLRFALLFPAKPYKISKGLFLALYIISGTLIILLSIVFYFITKETSIEWIRTYISLFDLSSIFTVLITLVSIAVFVYTYKTSKIESDRKKLRWLLLGFVIGPLSYLLFWVIPSRIWNQAFLPESVILLLVSAVPITFGIAIIKYRLMNIDIIIKRGLVYTIVIAILLIIYTAIIVMLTKLVHFSNSEISSIIAAISIALLFQPAKTRVQKIIDRKFFRINYDYRTALKILDREIGNIHDPKYLLTKVMEFINNLIHVKSIAILKFNRADKRLIPTVNLGFNNGFKNNIDLISSRLQKVNTFPITDNQNVEVEEAFTEILIEKIGIPEAIIILQIKEPGGNLHGYLILGEKLSETKYSHEDIDLLKIITKRLALILDRIELQEEVIKERLYAEKQEELNKLKSFFISSVSHDLKTPLTSIKLFAERLRNSKNVSNEKVEEYLRIIEGESDRLTRLINNVLDYAKIEKGIHQYNFKRINLVEVVNEVMKIMDYLIKINKFTIETKFNCDEIFIYADKDAVSEAIINIISNSLKYYSSEKKIIINVLQIEDSAVIEIEDKGQGISPDELDNIFEPFYRSKNLKVDKAGGAGLGLPIVKHIMDSHKGRIEVKSKLGEGSKFSLLFQLILLMVIIL